MAETVSSEIPRWMQQRVAAAWMGDDSVSRDIQLGAQIAQQAQELQQRNRQIQLQEEGMRLKLEAQRFINNGAMELGRIMEEGGKGNLYADPAFEAKIWALGQRYPQLLDSDVFKGSVNVVQNAKKAKASLTEIETRLKHERTPVDVIKTEYANTWRAQADAAETAGDTAKAEELRRSVALLEGTMLAPQETIETFTDEQGKPGVRVIKGAAPAKGSGLTVATQTDIQKRQLGYAKSMGMAKTLLNVLKPQNVGVLGAGQQIIVDEGLAQVIPELASQQNVDARTLLRVFNETMLKTLKADSQLNQKEEQRILAALPKTGANESFPGAVAKIVRALTELHSMAVTDAKTAGLPEPAFPLDPQTLQTLVKSKKLDADIAVQLWEKYYPTWQPQ